MGPRCSKPCEISATSTSAEHKCIRNLCALGYVTRDQTHACSPTRLSHTTLTHKYEHENKHAIRNPPPWVGKRTHKSRPWGESTTALTDVRERKRGRSEGVRGSFETCFSQHLGRADGLFGRQTRRGVHLHTDDEVLRTLCDDRDVSFARSVARCCA